MATRVGAAYLEITAKNAQLKSKMRESEAEGRRFTQRLGAALKRFGKVAFAGAIAGFAALTAVMIKAARVASKIEDLEYGFRKLTGSAENAARMFRAVDEAFKGTVKRAEIFEMVNNALLLDLPSTAAEMAELAKAGRVLGKAVGKDARFGFNSLVVGIGRGSRLMLDNLGIIVRTDSAYREYALRLGKTVEALTDAEKKTAFYNAAIEAVRQRVNRLGKDVLTTSDRWNQLTVAVDDAWAAFGRGALDEISTSFENLGDVVKENEGRFERWGRIAAKAIAWVAEKLEPVLAVIEATQEEAIRPAELRPRRVAMKKIDPWGILGAAYQPAGTAAQQRYEEGMKRIVEVSSMIIDRVRRLASERKIGRREEELWLDAIINVYQESYNQTISYEEALKRLTALDKERGQTITKIIEKTKELTRVEKESAAAAAFTRGLQFRMDAAERELEAKRRLNRAEEELVKILERQKAKREAIRLIKKLDVKEEIRPAPKFPALTKEQIDKIFPVAEAPKQTTAPRWMSAEQVWKEAMLAGVRDPKLIEAKKQTKAAEETKEILEDIDGNLVRLLTLE